MGEGIVVACGANDFVGDGMRGDIFVGKRMFVGGSDGGFVGRVGGRVKLITSAFEGLKDDCTDVGRRNSDFVGNTISTVGDTTTKSTVGEKFVVALSVTIFSTVILARNVSTALFNLDLKPAIDFCTFENENNGVSLRNMEGIIIQDIKRENKRDKKMRPLFLNLKPCHIYIYYKKKSD